MQRFETKYDLLNKAYKDDNITKGTLTLFQYLVHKSDKKGCFPKVDTIASALGCCRRTVQYNMRKLEKTGYIIRKDRWYNHQQLSNMYSFNVGVMDEKEYNVYENNEEIPEPQYEDLCQEKKDKGFKSTGIKKIFESEMGSYDKLLLIYCYHKADKKGIMYGGIDEFCKALGINKRTLNRLLTRLRTDNLIQVRTVRSSGKSIYVIKLTDHIMTELFSKKACCNYKFVHASQSKAKDQRIKNVDHNLNTVNNIQTDNIMNHLKQSLHHRFDEWIGSDQRLQNHIQCLTGILKKSKNAVLARVNKIREILRFFYL